MKGICGFSLMELIVTMLIAGVIAAVALPLLSDSSTRASWYHEQVIAAVRYAQRQAVAQRRDVHVNVGAAQIRLCYDAACAVPLTQITNGQAYALPAPNNVALSPTQTFSFNGLGRPSGAASFNVGGYSVTVAAETGYVQHHP
jgi:MSHA pilin protein MshC